MATERNRRKMILNRIPDLVGNFLYYDRKEDPHLPRGSVEKKRRQKETQSRDAQPKKAR